MCSSAVRSYCALLRHQWMWAASLLSLIPLNPSPLSHPSPCHPSLFHTRSLTYASGCKIRTTPQQSVSFFSSLLSLFFGKNKLCQGDPLPQIALASPDFRPSTTFTPPYITPPDITPPYITSPDITTPDYYFTLHHSTWSYYTWLLLHLILLHLSSLSCWFGLTSITS